MLNEVVAYIVKSLVEDVHDVEITETQRENGKWFIGIKISERDLGKVIGRNGRTIKAIRSLVHAINTTSKEIIIHIAS